MVFSYFRGNKSSDFIVFSRQFCIFASQVFNSPVVVRGEGLLEPIIMTTVSTLIIEVITMRLRNILFLSAIAVLTIGVSSCGKKADEPKPADSMMTPAPAPAPGPAMDTIVAPAGTMEKK